MASLEAGSSSTDNTGFAAAFVREQPLLRRIAAGLGFAANDLDDILQDVYLELTQKPPQYRGEREARSWLIRLTVNRGLREYRRRRRFQRHAPEILDRQSARRSDRDSDISRQTLRTEEIELIRLALQQLDGSLAAVLVLRYWCGYDSTRIGEFLELPPATVRGRLRKARLLLANRLGEQGLKP